ncbi:AraC family transcriptional regulator [Nocardia yunnanensis]|uniref:AraC family transcriptional regulator n=2 Tax=Nocardia yunnanensis TaxID=2382165 RepID=A0A386ZRD8_9NOCA|nr:AraC family transcriptional regulator [Nocardia yunnanensis]
MAGFGDRGRTPPELRLIPHPAVTILLVFGGTVGVRDPAGRRHVGSVVIGPGFGDVLRAVEVAAYDCVQVRLSPIVAHSVLGPAATEIGAAVVALDDLIGAAGQRLCEQLDELDDWNERFAWTEEWLARRCSTGSGVHPELTWAWQRMTVGRGLIRIEELAAELGWSRKRLWSRFHSQLGLPPKRAATLIRFDHAVHRLVVGQSPAAVAADYGYSDQAHLHREIRAFTGLTPAAVVDEPFLAVDDRAWGWPGRPSPAGPAR